MNESVTEVFVEQPLASPGSAKAASDDTHTQTTDGRCDLETQWANSVGEKMFLSLCICRYMPLMMVTTLNCIFCVIWFFSLSYGWCADSVNMVCVRYIQDN